VITLTPKQIEFLGTLRGTVEIEPVNLKGVVCVKHRSNSGHSTATLVNAIGKTLPLP